MKFKFEIDTEITEKQIREFVSKPNVQKGLKISAIAVVTSILVAGTLGKRLDMLNAHRTCFSMAHGEDLTKAGFGDKAPLFVANNSMDALVAQCSDAIGQNVSPSCIAPSIRISIKNGLDIPRPLIEDARAETGQCVSVNDPFKLGGMPPWFRRIVGRIDRIFN